MKIASIPALVINKLATNSMDNPTYRLYTELITTWRAPVQHSVIKWRVTDTGNHI